MISFLIEDTKECMQKLLKETVFDDFLCSAFELIALYKVTIDGQLRREILSSDEKECLEDRQYIKWSELKTIAYDMIRGNRTPTSLKIVFSITESSKKAMLQRIHYSDESSITSFTFSFIYENKRIKIITGTNYNHFTMDRHAEQYFDDTMLKFFKKHQINTMLSID